MKKIAKRVAAVQGLTVGHVRNSRSGNCTRAIHEGLLRGFKCFLRRRMDLVIATY